MQAAQGSRPRLHLHPPQPGAPGDPYVAYSKAKVTTSYTLHGTKGDLFLGKATQTFKKKSVFRLPKKLTPKR